MNAQAKGSESWPAGRARSRVRGLAASMCRSAMRLKAIAQERAPTIASAIQSNCRGAGSPPAASTAPSSAKGSAKSVCSILIISSVVRSCRAAVRMVRKSPLGQLSGSQYAKPAGRLLPRRAGR